MNFLKHSNLEGQHAFLGASKYHWINYDPEKIDISYRNFLATQKGTLLHAFACDCIRLGQKLKYTKTTIGMYVNDAIGYKMTPEQILYYSDNCFGTADAISYRNDVLRIHDFKSGLVPAHMEQLRIYAALFCLEYNQVPKEIILRIYQSNEIVEDHPSYEIDIFPIMEKIKAFDKIINNIKAEELLQ